MNRPFKPEWVLVHCEEGSVSIANSRTGAVLVSNASGAQILELCNGKREIQEIVTQLSQQFSAVDPSQIEKDVIAFIALAREYGLVVNTSSVAEPGPSSGNGVASEIP